MFLKRSCHLEEALGNYLPPAPASFPSRPPSTVVRTNESPAQPGGLQQAGRQDEAGTFPPGNSAREEKTEKMEKDGLGIKRQPDKSR